MSFLLLLKLTEIVGNVTVADPDDTVAGAATVLIEAAGAVTDDGTDTVASLSVLDGTTEFENAPVTKLYYGTAGGIGFAGEGDPFGATLGALPLEAVGNTTVANVTIVDPTDTVAGAATVAIDAAFTPADPSDTVSAAATVALAADFAPSDPADTVAGAATVAVSAAFTVTDPADTVAAGATVAISATFTVTEAANDDTVVATVENGDAPGDDAGGAHCVVYLRRRGR